MPRNISTAGEATRAAEKASREWEIVTAEAIPLDKDQGLANAQNILITKIENEYAAHCNKNQRFMLGQLAMEEAKKNPDFCYALGKYPTAKRRDHLKHLVVTLKGIHGTYITVLHPTESELIEEIVAHINRLCPQFTFGLAQDI